MIDQWWVYIGCYALGWAPLRVMADWVQSVLPSPLQPNQATWSVFPLAGLVHVALEVGRGVAIIHVVHEQLVHDVDLLLGVGLFLAGVFWPLRVTKRSPRWMALTGVYGALFPMVGWAFPLLYAVGSVAAFPYWYVVVASMYVVVGVLSGHNSLYVVLYVVLCGMVAIQSERRSST